MNKGGLVKTKMTLHEVYMKIKELRECRDLFARCIAEAILEDNQKSVEHFKEGYKNVENLIDYYSEIEVEF